MAEGKEGRGDNKLIEKGGEEVKKYYIMIFTLPVAWHTPLYLAHPSLLRTPLITWQSSNRRADEADLLLRSHPLLIFS